MADWLRDDFLPGRSVNPPQSQHQNQMSDIPPAPAKSPIVIIGLIALAGAVIALIGYIWAHL
jgi:hypothetical protein